MEHQTDEAVRLSRVVTFPLRRRRGEICAAAESLRRTKTKAAREHAWSEIIDRLSGELRRNQAASNEVVEELSSFHREVSRELSSARLAVERS